jgi:hypothetical protein
MKKLLTHATVMIISIAASAQTSLDSALFNKINEYRLSKKLKMIKWDTTSYKAARHHSQYPQGKNFISHYEDSAAYEDMDNRYEYFGGKTDRLSEIIALDCLNIHDDDPCRLDKLAAEILNLWKIHLLTTKSSWIRPIPLAEGQTPLPSESRASAVLKTMWSFPLLFSFSLLR